MARRCRQICSRTTIVAWQPSNPLSAHFTHQLSSIFDRITKRAQHFQNASPRIPSGEFSCPWRAWKLTSFAVKNVSRVLLSQLREWSAAACVPYPIRIGTGIGIGIGIQTGFGRARGLSGSEDCICLRRKPAGGIISTLNSEGTAGACLNC